MAFRIELLTDEAQLFALEPEWNALLQNSVANNIFLTWEWVSNWWLAFGEDYHLWIVTAREDRNGRLLGIAPLVWRYYLQSKRLPMRELRFIGSNQAAPDHLDFIVEKESKENIDNALAHFIWNNRKQWDSIFFDSVNPKSIGVRELCNLGDVRWQRVSPLACPIIKLPDSWDDFQKRLGKNLRKNLKRYDRHLRETGQMHYVSLTETNEVPAAFADLRRMHQAVRQAHGDGGAFKDSRMEKFQQQVATQFLQNGWLRFYQLQIDGVTIAADYNFFYNNIFSFYITGYDQNWSRYGPGRQITGYSVRCAIEEGAVAYDFLRGEEAYKDYWNAERYETSTVHIAISVRAKLLMWVREMKAWIRAYNKVNSETVAGVPTPSP